MCEFAKLLAVTLLGGQIYGTFSASEGPISLASGCPECGAECGGGGVGERREGGERGVGGEEGYERVEGMQGGSLFSVRISLGVSHSSVVLLGCRYRLCGPPLIHGGAPCGLQAWKRRRVAGRLTGRCSSSLHGICSAKFTT